MIIGNVINNQNNHNVNLSELPGLPAPIINSNNPSIAAPGDDFLITANGTAATNSPIISNHTEEAGADENILLTGEGLASMSTEFRVYKNGLLLTPSVSTMDTQKGSVKLPSSLGTWNAYALWPKNTFGYGSPIILNKAKAWWMDNKGVSGMNVSFYGKNLAHGNVEGTSNSYIYIQSVSGGTISSCTVVSVNPYKVQFTLPSLSNGDYKVWCHNGHGSDYGWSNPLTITIVSANSHVKTRSWGSTITPSLTSNNTSVDNAINISAAISTQGNAGGGIVHISAGTYYIQSQILTYYDNVKILGDVDGSGNPTSIIKVASGYAAASAGIWGAQDVKYFNMVENIIFDANGRTDIGTGQQCFLNIGSKEMFYFKNCQIIANGTGALRFYISNNLYFDKVRFVGGKDQLSSPVFIDDSQLFNFDNCTNEMTGDCDQAWQTWKCKQWTLTNSTIKDFDNTTTDGSGWGKGRILGNQGVGGGTEHVYIAGNNGQSLGVRMSGTSQPDANVGENYMFEGNSTRYSAYVSSATSTTATFATPPDNTDQAIPNYSFLKIVKGKGIGQCRKIIANNSGTLTIDDAWKVQPDSTSLIMIGYFVRRVIIYKNTSNSSSKSYIAGGSNHNASTGVNWYGGSHDCIFDGNTINSTRFGMSSFCTQSLTNTVDSNTFLEFKNNTLINCRIGAFLYAVNANNPATSLPATSLLSLLYRNNNFSGSIEADISYYLPTSDPGLYLIDNVVHEKSVMNQSIEYNAGYFLSVTNEVLSGNTP